MPDVNGDVAMRRERISASIRLKQSVIKHLSLEIISRHSLEGNLRYEKMWRKRIGELVHDIMHNAIWFHQLEHHKELVVDYENKVIPIVQKQFNAYNNFLDSMINRKICVDGVITPQISKAVDNKLIAVSSLLNNYAAALVAESTKETTSKRLDFPATSFKDIVCTNLYNKGRV